MHAGTTFFYYGGCNCPSRIPIHVAMKYSRSAHGQAADIICSFINFWRYFFVSRSIIIVVFIIVFYRFKFDDERVTKEDMKRALEEQYGGEEEVSPYQH